MTTRQNAALVVRFTPTVSLPPLLLGPMLSLGFSERTVGGVSFNISQCDVHVRTRFLISTVLTRLRSFLTIVEMMVIKMIITTRVNQQICHVCNI